MRVQMGLVAATLLASVAGCASAEGGPRNRSAGESERTTVRVENHNWSDMNVYIERGGMRTRLGTVTTATTRDFVVPRGILGSSDSFRLIADPIGGSSQYTTTPLLVSPGQLVEFKIENHVNLSSYTVWER